MIGVFKGGLFLKEKREELEENFTFDEIVSKLTGGMYTDTSENEPKIYVRKLIEYCKEKNINPSDISKEDYEKFIIP